MEGVIGEVFIRIDNLNPVLGEAKIRVIMPITKTHMMKFDLVVIAAKVQVEPIDILYYKRGDKYAEARAIEG